MKKTTQLGMESDVGGTDRFKKKPLLQVTEEKNMIKRDEVLLQNEVPKEQEEVDDQQQMEPRDDLYCPTKKPKEMVVMIVDRGRVMMMIGWEKAEVVALVLIRERARWGEGGDDQRLEEQTAHWRGEESCAMQRGTGRGIHAQEGKNGFLNEAYPLFFIAKIIG